MSRVKQNNTWGSSGGPDAQRSDLWLVDFTEAIAGLNDQIQPSQSSASNSVSTELEAISSLEPHFIQSVRLPALKVKAETIMRDSRPYPMPGFDEPFGEIQITFLMESPTDGNTSKVYRFLETWRAFVRAGRGSMGNEGRVPELNSDYRIDFKFPVAITLLRGNLHPKMFLTEDDIDVPQVDFYGGMAESNRYMLANSLKNLSFPEQQRRISQFVRDSGVDPAELMKNPLEACAAFNVDGMWLSGFKLTDLDYSRGNELLKIEATFYADSISDLSNSPNATA